MEAVQAQVKTRSLELKRELKACGVFYLSARGEIVAPHTVEVNTYTTRIAKELGRCVEWKNIRKQTVCDESSVPEPM